MYVIFPADEVVSLTYGRVLVPRLSDSEQLARVLNQLQEATVADATNTSEFSTHRFDYNHLGSRSPSGSNRTHSNRQSPDPVDGFKPIETDKKVKNTLASVAAATILSIAAVQPKAEKSPASKRQGNNLVTPELGPDPRLQLIGLQTPTPEKSPTKQKQFSLLKTKRQEKNMAASNDSILKELSHPSLNEALKSHNSVTFKLVRTVSDFTQQLSQIYEQHAEELQLLVSNFRKRNGELRKERPACPSTLFHTWETLLQEVEIDSQAHSDIASILGRQVSRPLLEKSFHRKIQSRKVFTHRESYEIIISKTEEKLVKCRQDYKNAYLTYLSQPTTQSLSAYFDTHNAYVQQLHAANGMLDVYSKETLPQLLQELEEIYNDLCITLSESVLQGAEVVSARAMEQHKRYEGLSSQCKTISGVTDLTHFARSLPQPPPNKNMMKKLFTAPQPPLPDPENADDKNEFQTDNIPPPLKNELVVDRLASVQIKPSMELLKKEAQDLEVQIKQISDALDTLLRIQQRSLESSLYNKVNEIQEDISMKRFDLQVAHIHLSAINHQKELFSNKLDTGDSGRDRKMSSASTGSMKSKWLKAFKSLKTPPASGNTSPRESDKKNQMYHAVSTIIAMRKNGAAGGKNVVGGDSDAHSFQEYTYKKITPCDVCSQVLRGHTRQGLKCRVCKLNVHVDCQDKVAKCQSKSRLLRRQKSTSEIETKIPETTLEEESYPEDIYFGMPTMNRQLSFKGSNNRLLSPDLETPEVDLIYQVLKQAGEISNTKQSQTHQQATITRLHTAIDASGTNNERPPVGILIVNDHQHRGGSGSAPGSSGSSGQSLNRRGQLCRPSGGATNLSVTNPVPHSTSSAPHSPRRQKLNLRMKSLSLDSPESTEHVQRRRHVGTAGTSEPQSNHSSSSRIQSPSSPVHNRRLLSARNMRMSSVELPDDNEKSLSSASTSPCPSPVGGKKSHRLLPTNLYVVLYNFKARHQDELDLKAGYKVTVIDTSDPDWWKGKCLGRVGYFPSKYCSKLAAGEKPLQVTHNLQVSDGENGLMLLRDQIVIQVGEELDGMVMIRSGDNRQGVCPLKFLQEV